ncbi:MAG: 7TM-DISM domain-containing protein [Pseudomonas sp.]|uniref:7TM-DISM domain-containing protein n=1 Tax=Pseudomonas sp. TaxID=306 RepID=UPI003D115423
MLLALLASSVLAEAALCTSSPDGWDVPAQGFEDPQGEMTAAEIAALPDERFLPVSAWPNGSYVSSAFWLRFSLRNDSDRPCSRWLSVGEPLLDSVQVNIQRDGEWTEMHAGSRYPLADWAILTRQPLFALSLDSGEHALVVVRIVSDSVMLVRPKLWTDAQQLEVSQHSYLIDGLCLGIGMLIVPFSLVLALMMRSRLLLVHALAILAYLLLVCAATGYLLYLPALLPWVQEVVSLLSCLASVLFTIYVYVLFKLHLLGRGWRLVWASFAALMGGMLLWGGVDGYIETRILFNETRWLTYFLVPLACLLAWYKGLKPSWLAWLLAAMFVTQGVSRHVLGETQASWHFGEDPLSTVSILPGVFLLVCTLVMEFRRSRQGERRAIAELDAHQQAEHERLEITVERRTEQLRESLRARSSLLARITHDLRSPLTGIIDYAQLLRAETPHDYPQRIERNARHQLEMIDELLEFSRSELQQQELVLAPGYLYGFLHEIEDEGRFLAKRKGNLFTCDFASDLPLLVHADFRRLRRVLINLVSNAAKFTHAGSISFTVEVVGGDEAVTCLRFCLRDTGIGIHSEEAEHLLQPFSRGRNAASYEGSGLGLSIVAQLLHQMGSELVIESAPARGSQFSFLLSLVCANEQELDVVMDGTGGAIHGEGRSILLVDDIEQNREALSDLLGGYGFDILIAQSAEQALALLTQQPVDVLITDQMMPGHDGWWLLRRVRELRPELPVLLYSAAPPLRPETVPATLGFDDALLKPANGSELLDRVAQLLTLAR